MSNRTVDKINRFLSNSSVSSEIPMLSGILNTPLYRDEDTGVYFYLAIPKKYRNQYYEAVDNIYRGEILNTYAYKTVEKKFHKFLLDVKKKFGYLPEREYSRFCQELINKTVEKFEVFHKLYGFSVNTEQPVELGSFCIYNYKKHQQFILNKTSFKTAEELYEHQFTDFREYDLWISTFVMARDTEKAKELAYIKFEQFQGMCRYLVPLIDNVYYVGILNDKKSNLDAGYLFSKNSLGFYSDRTDGRFQDLEITAFMLENQVLLNWMLEKIDADNKYEIDNRIINAIVLYGRAEQEQVNSQKFLLYIMSVEALVEMNGQEIANQISDYVATLFSNTNSHRNKIIKEFKSLYRKRSAIAHGSEVNVSDDNVSAAEDYSRQMIYQFFANKRLSKVKTNTELSLYIDERRSKIKEKTNA